MTKSEWPNRLLACVSSFDIRASSFFVGHHPSPQTLRSPNSGAQAFQLHYLAMIDKEVHVCAVVFDVPREHIGISGFKHKPVHTNLVDEFRGNIRAPWIDILGNALALDHDDVRTSLEKSFCLPDRPAWIACPFRF